MTYGWAKQKDGVKKPKPSNPSHSFALTNASATIAGVDPMEDWEKATRMPHVAEAANGKPLWQPVYVRLAGSTTEAVRKSAKHLLDFIKGEMNGGARTIYLTSEADDFLSDLLKVGAKVDPDDPGLCFFIFRPETLAYHPVPDPKLRWYDVLQVGPSIPGSAAENLVSPLDSRSVPIKLDGQPPCVTAVIDDQIGFLNARFAVPRGPNGPRATRIHRLSLMGQPRFEPKKGSSSIGSDLTPDAIDALFADYQWEEDGYERTYPTGVRMIGIRMALDLFDDTFRRPFAFQAGHGTHVMDLAAGFPTEWNRTDRPIFAVQLPRLAAAETSGARLDLFVLLALIRILNWADETYWNDEGPVRVPVVINISYGVLAGPKDGTGFLESEIARRVAWRNRTAVPTRVVMPSGNGFRERTRARFNLTTGEGGAITLRVLPEDLSVSFVEIWLDGLPKPNVKLTVAPPIGEPTTIRVGKAPKVVDWTWNGGTIGRVYVQKIKASGRWRVVLALAPTLNHDRPNRRAPAGAYVLTLHNDASQPADVTIDVQRDDTPSTFPQFGRQAYLDHATVTKEDPETYDLNMPDISSPVTRNGTLSALACSTEEDVIVVGGAFDRHSFSKAALYSASGLGLRCGGPRLAAVSEESRAHPGILASGLFSGSAAIFSGTSAAAPQVTRALVDQISEQLANGVPVGKIQTDPSAFLDPKHTFTSQDARLGSGVMAFEAGPSRPRRRDPA